MLTKDRQVKLERQVISLGFDTDLIIQFIEN